MDNLVLPFQLDNASVRGRIVRLGGALDDILTRHAYPPALMRMTAEASILSLVISSLLKYDGIFTLQAQGDGPVRMHVRANEVAALRVFVTAPPASLTASSQPLTFRFAAPQASAEVRTVFLSGAANADR